jgi:hypothetical protein
LDICYHSVCVFMILTHQILFGLSHRGGWAGRVTRIGEAGDAGRVLVEKSEEKITL